MLPRWLCLAACCAAALCLPFPSANEEADGEASRKVLGSSVVTSVSVIMDLGNGTKKYYADPEGKPVSKPTSASLVGSPSSLLHPDRYEFYTFNEAGDLVKRLMTLEEIQGIIASGDGDGGELPPSYYHQQLPQGLKSPALLGEGDVGELSSPVDGVHEVVESVQNVLKEEMEAARNKTTAPRPATTLSSTWRPEEPSGTPAASVPTTHRPSSRKPVKTPSPHVPSSSVPTTTTRTTGSSTARSPSTTNPSQEISSRRPVSSSSLLPAKKPAAVNTENPLQSKNSSTVRYSTTEASSASLMTSAEVSEKEETTSKRPLTSDIDGNFLDNDENQASASNINTEIVNNTKSNVFGMSQNGSSVQPPSDKEKFVDTIVTSSWTTVIGKTTEKPAESYQNSEHSSNNDNEYSQQSSVTSIQNIKPSVMVIANSTINTISTGKPISQQLSNNNAGENMNAESNNNGGDFKPSKNSSTSIQNVQPMVTIIINSTVNTASGATTIRDPISAKPLLSFTASYIPGVPNLQESPSSTVTERIAAEDSSEEYTTNDSSSEEDSSENSSSFRPVSTELPDSVFTTLLQILGADLTTQPSEEYESTESENKMTVVPKINESAASSNIEISQIKTDMGTKTPANSEDMASPSQINPTKSTEMAEHLQSKPMANDSFLMERNHSISTIVEMLMDENPSDVPQSSIPVQNLQNGNNENALLSLQEKTKESSTTVIPPKESIKNISVTEIASNTSHESLAPNALEGGTVVLYSNDLIPQKSEIKSVIKYSPTKSSLSSEEKLHNKTLATTTPKYTSEKTSEMNLIQETTTTLLETRDSTTSGFINTDSDTYTSTEYFTDTSKYSELEKTTDTLSVTSTNTKLMKSNTTYAGNKIPASSDIDEVIERGTISPDSYFIISGNGGPIEESDLLAPPEQQNVYTSKYNNTYITNGGQLASNASESENPETSNNFKTASSDKKYAVTKINRTESYTFAPSLVSTESVETDEGKEEVNTTSTVSTITTKKSDIITPDVPTDIPVAQSGIVPIKISPEMAESMSNVMSQISNKIATTIFTTDKEMIPDMTTQITTTNFEDSPSTPVMSSVVINQVEQEKVAMKNNTGTLPDTEPYVAKVSQGSLNTAETNNIFNTVTAHSQETTTSLYSDETTGGFTMDDKVKEENESMLATRMSYKNGTEIDEIVKNNIDVKNKSNVSELSTTHLQHETHASASSLVNEYTGISEKHNENLDETKDSTTMTSQENSTPEPASLLEETSTILSAETPADSTAFTTLMTKNKPPNIVSVPEVDDQTTTLIPVTSSTESIVTDKLPLASQIKGTQVKLIDNEDEQMLKVDIVTVPNRESSNVSMVNQTVLEEPSTTWHKIFDSSKAEANRTTSKLTTGAVTESIKETNYIDIIASDTVNDNVNATKTNSVHRVKPGEVKNNILEGGNSLIAEDKPNEQSISTANKNISKIVIVPGITQAIFHTEEYDHFSTTGEPPMTTTNGADPVAETILPSKYVEFVVDGEATSAEAATTEDATTEQPENVMDLDNEVQSTEKTWAPVSTVTPPQAKITTSRTADQTTRAHVDVKATTVRRPAQSTVDLRPAPEESLGLESSMADLDKDVGDFAELCNELALKLWKPAANRRATVSRSLVMSPFAVTSLLAMVFLGARGGTSGQMNDILRLDDVVTFNPHQVFRNVTESLVATKNPGVATAAFVRELYSDKAKGKLLDFYKERAQQFYDGHVEEVNFNMVGDVVRRRTNLLVKRQTSGRVSEYIRGTNIMLRPPLSVFSANIFQTDCSGASTAGRDGEMYFTVIPASRQRRLVPVPAAVWRSGFLAGYDPQLDATAAALGGADSLVSTVLLLPGQQGNVAPGDSVAALEERLWNSAWSRGAWSSLLPHPGLELQLPRFSHRSMLNLTDTLQRMGLKDLFSEGRADLKGLNGLANDLHLSDIVQVNTFGTCGELTADARHHVEVFPGASQRSGRREARRLDLYSIPLELRPRQAREPDAPRLRFDRPFLYAVRHNPTGLILHMGRFNPRLVR
ncbi:mucin-2 isoform X2 [Bacillus rossius redtenbacheri]|uniref:mucin-2 isoform X2 n=1 Tax=Bacillus rossius redtenbacheri TaxID=93214 RepID=UPI002FDE18B3